VKGKIRYGTLVVEEGGELSGDVDSLTTAAVPASSPAKPSSAAPSTTPAPKPEVVQSPRGAVG